MVWTPSTLDHAQAVGTVTTLTALVVGAIWWAVATTSRQAAFVGRFVFAGAVGCCLVWGMTEILVTGGSVSTPACTFGGLGFGLAVGFMVGRVLWALRNRPPDEGDE